MPAPSAYLTEVQTRLSDRRALAQRDIQVMLEGLQVKSQLLEELRAQVLRHRCEDLAQLLQARRENWASWEVKLKRLEEWMKAASAAARSTATLRAWQDGARGLSRAQAIARKFTGSLERLAAKLDRQLKIFADDMNRWSDRLKVKEADVRAFLDRQEAKTTEIMVSKARKQPFLDFVYVEREEEGRLALRLKSLRAVANQTLARLDRAERWVREKSADTMGQFDESSAGLLNAWRPLVPRFNGLREAALDQALVFEESRQRLRWIYEQVQRMRVVQESAPARKPLIERLFGATE